MLRSRDALIRSRIALIHYLRGAVKACGAAAAFHRKVGGHISKELRPAPLPLLGPIESLNRAVR